MNAPTDVAPGDPTARARELVLAYFDHMYDLAHVGEVVDLLGLDGALDLLTRMTWDGDPDGVPHARVFVEDVYRIMGVPGFRAAYHRSGFPVRARQALRHPDPVVRGHALYHLTRLGDRRFLPDLRDAFGWYLTHDPLRLDCLVPSLAGPRGASGQLRWHLRVMAASPRYPVRWAAVSLALDLSPAFRPRFGWARQVLRQLATDPHPWVRAEARWTLDAVCRAAPPPHPRARRGPRGEVARPPLTFHGVGIGVRVYLGLTGRLDYDDSVCTAVGGHMLAHPVHPEWNREEYWRPLLDRRGERVQG